MMIRIYFKSKKKKVTKKQLQDHQDFERSINAIPLPSGSKFLPTKVKAQKKSVFTYRVPRDIVRAKSFPTLMLKVH
jgi:secreted Zn-dependent insulinase-like peptidase